MRNVAACDVGCCLAVLMISGALKRVHFHQVRVVEAEPGWKRPITWKPAACKGTCMLTRQKEHEFSRFPSAACKMTELKYWMMPKASRQSTLPACLPTRHSPTYGAWRSTTPGYAISCNTAHESRVMQRPTYRAVSLIMALHSGGNDPLKSPLPVRALRQRDSCISGQVKNYCTILALSVYAQPPQGIAAPMLLPGSTARQSCYMLP
jgi:hypothetical protein